MAVDSTDSRGPRRGHARGRSSFFRASAPRHSRIRSKAAEYTIACDPARSALNTSRPACRSRGREATELDLAWFSTTSSRRPSPAGQGRRQGRRRPSPKRGPRPLPGYSGQVTATPLSGDRASAPTGALREQSHPDRPVRFRLLRLSPSATARPGATAMPSRPGTRGASASSS